MSVDGPPAGAPSADEVTALLRKWGEGGDREALDQLIPLVSRELRQIAGRLFASERGGHTLQPTALVSEAYVRLLGRQRGQWNSRLHFFCFAAREMRRVLVDHARRDRALKRGHGIEIVSLDGQDSPVEPKIVDLLALDEALERLAELDPRHAKVVELHYFAGLSVEEIASALEVSRPTAYRDLAVARAWLKRRLATEP
ncbi:MAG: sigma-70 family RNA polymerase sigma factor [Acidobacteriota bacterium]